MPTVTYRHYGDRIDYTPAAAVEAGDVIVLNTDERIGIATADIAANALGSLAVEGVFNFPKSDGSSTALVQGDLVFWDVADQEINTDSANPMAGIVAKAASDDDTTVDVKLHLY